MIKVRNANKKYAKLLALNDFTYNFKSDKGRIYVIRGVSGSGKSTLLNLIGLLDQPSQGEVTVEGISIQSSAKEITRLRRETLGFVFQDFQLNPAYTAQENVVLPLLINPDYTLETAKERANELLCLMGLGERSDHYSDELSGGEKQRVSIARAMANNPQYIIADEPTENLDKSNEKMVMDQFVKLRDLGVVVIIASHSDVVWEYAQTVLTLESGRLIEVHDE